MKKKVVAIIALATSGLLLGGLIYCGISAFPELLEPEKKVEKVSNQEFAPVIEEKVSAPSPAFAEKEETVPSSVSTGLVGDFIPSSYNGADVVYIGFANGNKTKKSSEISLSIDESFKHESSTNNDRFTFIEIEEPVTVVTKVTSEKEPSVSHVSSSESEKVESVIKTSKAKAKTTKKHNSDHREIAECSLLVVGIISVISFVSIEHKKRKLLR